MFDNLAVKETLLHKVNPSLKLMIVALLFVSFLFVHNPNIMVNFAIVLYLLFFFGTGHSKKLVLLASIPFFIMFLSTSSSMIMFGKGETVIFQWALIKISEESLLRGIHIGFRALVFASLGLLFAFTTRPVQLFYSLMQQLKVKPKYAYSFMAGLRTLPIIFVEFQTLRYALKVRGAENGKGIKGFYLRLKRYSIPLLSQSIRRAHRIAVAMEAKRFSTTGKRTYYYIIKFSKVDILFILLLSLLLLIVFLLSLHFPYVNIDDVRY